MNNNYLNDSMENNFSSLRSKSIRRKKRNKTIYEYITNFDNTTEKECKEMDKNNKNIYKRNSKLYDDIIKIRE